TEVVREHLELVEQALTERHGEEETLLIEQPGERAPAVSHQLERVAGGQAGHDVRDHLLAHHRDEGGHVRDRTELPDPRTIEERGQAEELPRSNHLHEHREAALPRADHLHGTGDEEVRQVVCVLGRKYLLPGPPVRHLGLGDERLDRGNREAEAAGVSGQECTEGRLRGGGAECHVWRLPNTTFVSVERGGEPDGVPHSARSPSPSRCSAPLVATASPLWIVRRPRQSVKCPPASSTIGRSAAQSHTAITGSSATSARPVATST